MPVVDDVAYSAASILANFAISSDGRVAIVRHSSEAGNQFVWFDRNGDETGTLGPSGAYSAASNLSRRRPRCFHRP